MNGNFDASTYEKPFSINYTIISSAIAALFTLLLWNFKIAQWLISAKGGNTPMHFAAGCAFKFKSHLYTGLTPVLRCDETANRFWRPLQRIVGPCTVTPEADTDKTAIPISTPDHPAETPDGASRWHEPW